PPHLASSLIFPLPLPPHPTSTLFPYTTLFRSHQARHARQGSAVRRVPVRAHQAHSRGRSAARADDRGARPATRELSGLVLPRARSEEHTSELQSRENLVCRLLLEKKKKKKK